MARSLTSWISLLRYPPTDGYRNGY